MVEVTARMLSTYILITIVIGIACGLNHSYGGKIAVEIGVGKPGVGISPVGYGQ